MGKVGSDGIEVTIAIQITPSRTDGVTVVVGAEADLIGMSSEADAAGILLELPSAEVVIVEVPSEHIIVDPEVDVPVLVMIDGRCPSAGGPSAALTV
jgi:hypothetical protein